MQLQVEEYSDAARAADGGHDLRPVPEIQLQPDLDGADVWRDEPGPPRSGLQVGRIECDGNRRRLGQRSSLGPGITLQRAPGKPPPRRGARLVGQPDDVRQALDPPAGQLLLKLAEDPDAGGRVMED